MGEGTRSRSQPILASNGQTDAEGSAPVRVQLYYVLSLKWTRGEDMMWWGPNNCGYTTDLNRAGIYTAEQIAEAPEYYDSGRSSDGTLAIPVESVQRHARPVAYVPHRLSVYRSLRAARNRARRGMARSADTTGVSDKGSGMQNNKDQRP